jgi:histidyl-tRNA synthetase
VIEEVFTTFGYLPIETPTMESLQTLTGKYGEEGDRLLFKILNNGDFLQDVDSTLLQEKNSTKLISQISKRGLRYDLTVPFASCTGTTFNCLLSDTRYNRYGGQIALREAGIRNFISVMSMWWVQNP